MKEISNRQDVIDSRDIIERIEELERCLDTCPHCGEGILIEEGEKQVCPDCENELFDEGEANELKVLKALADECEGYSDWEHGEALIRESYWVQFVEDLCKDIGDLPSEVPWYIAIDWDQTAENISADYSRVDFDGVEYYIRNC